VARSAPLLMPRVVRSGAPATARSPGTGRTRLAERARAARRAANRSATAVAPTSACRARLRATCSVSSAGSSKGERCGLLDRQRRGRTRSRLADPDSAGSRRASPDSRWSGSRAHAGRSASRPGPGSCLSAVGDHGPFRGEQHGAGERLVGIVYQVPVDLVGDDDQVRARRLPGTGRGRWRGRASRPVGVVRASVSTNWRLCGLRPALDAAAATVAARPPVVADASLARRQPARSARAPRACWPGRRS